MKSTLFLVIFLLQSSLLLSQSYFQQKVDYDMEVTLNVDAKSYQGSATISYTNNAQETVNQIYFHLWANAYSDNASELAKQQLRMGSGQLWFSKLEDRGGYSKIKFSQNGSVLNMLEYEGNKDVVILELAKGVAPGETIEIETEFVVKVPPFFSRMGRKGNYYQITQWYPKPAVFDKDGWHPMPYLDMGEFYSEFGDYKVTIKVPKGFEVAATGTLDFTTTDGSGLKRTVFKAENVHDFAWCTYDDFKIDIAEILLDDGHTVQLKVFRINDSESWTKAPQFLKNAILFYSKEVAQYPYPQATVVQSPGGTGGGMEYPMLTTIDDGGDEQSIDVIIAHEVGHNWFYGILASNERDFAWMDEGMNSYYDHKYNDKYYNQSSSESILPKMFSSGTETTVAQHGYLFQCKRCRNQSCAVGSGDYNLINYGLASYEFPAWSFKYLNRYLGPEVFDNCIAKYYDDWKFKHPSPDDLQSSFETVSGKELDWFFDGLLFNEGYMDYAIKSVTRTDDKIKVDIKNKGQLGIPICLDLKEGGEWIKSHWIEGFEGDTSLYFQDTKIDEFAINGALPFIDINPDNNFKRLDGEEKKKFNVRLIPKIDNPRVNELYVFPFTGWNHYDGGFLGLSAYNSFFPQKNFRINANAGYGFKSKDWLGTFLLEKDFLVNSDKVRKIMTSVSAKKFGYFNSDSGFDGEDIELDYYKVKPGISLHFQPNFKKKKESWIAYNFHYLAKQEYKQGPVDQFIIERDQDIFHTLDYHLVQNHPLRPTKFNARLLFHSNDDFAADTGSQLRLDLSFQGKLRYMEKSRFHYRLYAGYFLDNNYREYNTYNNIVAKASLNLASGPSSDVLFDDYYFGRTYQNHWTENQIYTNRGGGFKVPLTLNTIGLGQSNNGMLALNLKVDIPIPAFKVIPIKPYFDIGTFSNYNFLEQQHEWDVMYDGGLALEFGDGIFGIYLSLVQSKDLKMLYDSYGFGRRISFQFDIGRLNTWKFLDTIDL